MTSPRPTASGYNAEPTVNLRAMNLRRVTTEMVEDAAEHPYDTDPATPYDEAAVSDYDPEDYLADPGAESPAPVDADADAQARAEAVAALGGDRRAQSTGSSSPRRTPAPAPVEPEPDRGVGMYAAAAPALPVDPDPVAAAIGDGGRAIDFPQVRADLLAANPGIETDPAEWGRRGRLNQTLGTRMAPTPAEVDYRYAVELVKRAALPAWFTVMIANNKGGQGKTPTTLMLSYLFGMFRGAGTVAWDNNESKGTLGDRAASTTRGAEWTVWDLLENADALAGPNAQSGALSGLLRRQPTYDEVLASDRSSKRMKGIGARECDAVAAVLRRHRTGVFVDTGNDDLAENWKWTADHADLLVIPMTYRHDAARTVGDMLDGLHARGLDRLVQRAIVALAPTPGADPGDRDLIAGALADAGISRFVDVPYEPLFEGSGTRIAEDRLTYSTHVAYTHLAAEVAASLEELYDPQSVAFDSGFIPEAISRPPEHDIRRTSPQAPRPRY